MPPDHSFGLNDDQDLFPSRPDLRQEDPEAPIGRSDPGSAPFLGERGELLTKGEFDNRLFASASKERRNTAKGDRREFEQVSHRRCILHGVTAQYETDSSAGLGLSSVVDLSSTERKSSINPRRTEFENTQLDNRLIEERSGVINMNSAVERRERLGGVLNYYERRAA